MKKRKVLVANRGEIAVRIIKACKALGVDTVLAVSEADRESMAADLANEVICIGPPQARQSYLEIHKIIAAAEETGADAIHPGYGFLSENPDLPEACAKNGLLFIGPRADTMRRLGDKISARRLAREAGVPMAEGSQALRSFEDVEHEARRIGFPVILKASAGGGGRGMRIVRAHGELREAFHLAANEAASAFGDPTLFLERYIEHARHVEVQVIGDHFGKLIHLGHRDCTAQRRHQKVIEEAPCCALPDALRGRMLEAAVALTASVGYHSAGTVEFLVDRDRDEFYFMEVNTRIQVEHPVTEAITCVDLVEEQIRIAYGAPLSIAQDDVRFRGHAIECRITAEDPRDDFFPSPGCIEEFVAPGGAHVRLDTHCYRGYTVGPYYDSLLGKLITTGETRVAALAHMAAALDAFRIEGLETNIEFLRFVIAQPAFVRGDIHTRWIEDEVVPAFVKSVR